MLLRLEGKKVRVGVTFGDMGTGNYTKSTATKYFEGTIIDMNTNFIVFDNGSMIGISYIQTIKML